jgi:aarF domain-containing kinase
MCRELQNDKRLAFAKMIYSASSMDFGSLLASFDEMGLKLKRQDPAEDMKNIRFVLRDTAPGDEMRKQFTKFREDVWQKRQQLSRSQRNPVEAYPAELLFFFRVTLLLRGLCAVLRVRVRYSALLAPYAHLALLRSHPPGIHVKDAVVPRPLPYGAAALPAAQTAVTEALKALFRLGLCTGVQVAVYYRGQLVVDACAGTLGEADPRPVRSDSIFNCFSVTKGVTATALHLLKQQGRLAYSDTVAGKWPAFAAGRSREKAGITIEHVLTHSAGLHRVPDANTKLNQLCDWKTMLEVLEHAEPSAAPGAVTRYHILSFGWLVGGLVEKVTQTHFRDFIRETIAKPLNIEVRGYRGPVGGSGETA